ncbi:MAG: MBL fold metallo-hydrolase [Candidatus Omnitrophica bacterium]|nr:MBL fold metallo-hydrolase [Candidatus Omnitrophota bacterium]
MNRNIMEIKVIFDKDTKDKNLKSGWGVSFLIGDELLFDTGEKGEYLVENLKRLNIDIKKIKKVVISHDHWDHTGGLWNLLKIKKEINIYGCPGFSEKFKQNVKENRGNFVEVEAFTVMKENEIFLTGEIKGKYKGEKIVEQSLVIKSNNGISIITGCAHPGILRIVDLVRNYFLEEKIYAVIGGFHLIEKDKRIIEIIVDEFKKRNVEKVGPTHCAGITGINLFKEKYHNNFIEVRVGETIEL